MRRNRGGPRIREHAGAFNPDATELKELCAWDRNVFEPVLICKLSLEEITGFINTPMVVPDKPVHGQSMERAVKQVTRACESVFGYEARDGFIRAGVTSRETELKVTSLEWPGVNSFQISFMRCEINSVQYYASFST